MAYAFLKALGCDGDIGTITVDLAANKAEATDGHKVLSATDGTVEVESSRYPFCFYRRPASPSATSGIIEFFPFNEDLNRFKLVVTGLPAGTKAKVTWGKAVEGVRRRPTRQGHQPRGRVPREQPVRRAVQEGRAEGGRAAGHGGARW